ncbi:MAG: transferrin-binding protein-like solute binding protein [Paracoccaceae bacterium]
MNASGELVHNTGHTTVDIGEGYYVLVDPDGINPDTDIIQDGDFADGSGAEMLGDTTFSDGYEYVYAFQLRHKVNDVAHTARAVGGIVTHADHIPSAGSATYTGNAKGTIYNGTVFQQFGANATSSVDVNFEAGSVDVEMTNFEAAPDLVDTITITGMSLTGNTFSGGTVGAMNGGVAVDITGANAATFAGGNLFGYDSSISGPDEVGGVFETDGDDGWMVGYFLAD